MSERNQRDGAPVRRGADRGDEPERRRGRDGRAVWTVEEVRALGVTTNIPTAAEVLGIGRTLAFSLFGAGEFPVPVLRMGHRAVVPVAGLLKILDADGSPSGTDMGHGGQDLKRAV